MIQRWQAAMLVLLACCGAGRAGAQSFDVQVGERAVHIASVEGTVRVSEAALPLFGIYQTTLPPTLRLAEALASKEDVARALSGQAIDGTLYQVQVLRAIEGVEMGPDDWTRQRPELARQIGLLDMQQIGRDTGDGASARLTAATGTPIEMKFGEIGKLQRYGDDSRSLRFVLLLPVTLQAGGRTVAAQIECAGASVPLEGRLVFMYAYRMHHDASDATAVRAALDRWVDATLALDR